ncbi:thiol-disulfide oxidoreductase ResA [Fictibacillus aquaticus]|uniref:Thiol-disulfide oxidoreductase n=1 Tax=Fictibacillus aquaticus TaxID=2021314 RepID=A0A235F5K4_9BACL|nr:thiol-disulfide oxidoreductase ResA [Fictibacillus aquaticus]OYD55985.1 thiol-disulfide oxidoreductase [Fictibacillus aquaticus]
MKSKKIRLVFRTLLLIIIVGAVAYTLYSKFSNQTKIINEGDKAPNFILKDLNGNRVELEDYRGQGVFLNFWGTWCKPCEKEMPAMQRQYMSFKDKGVTILAINVAESEIAVRDFIEDYKLTFSIPMDKNRDVLKAYGVGTLPASFLINKEGEIVKIITGGLDDAKINKFMESIQP